MSEEVSHDVLKRGKPKMAEAPEEAFDSPRFGYSDGGADGGDENGGTPPRLRHGSIDSVQHSMDVNVGSPVREPPWSGDLMQGLEASFQRMNLNDSLLKLPPSLPLTPLPRHRMIELSSSSDDEDVISARRRVKQDVKSNETKSIGASSEASNIVRRKPLESTVIKTATANSSSFQSALESVEAQSDSSESVKEEVENVAAQSDVHQLRSKLKPSDRVKVAQHWYSVFNRDVFNEQLPKDASLVWNARLRKTAGQAVFVRYNKECSYHSAEEDLEIMMQGLTLTPRSGKNAYQLKRIELSTKILTTEEKLATTLLHECCHVAQRLLENENDAPHGPVFKKWAQKASKQFPRFKVTTRHDFPLDHTHRWICDSCQMIYGRYSKSIDPAKHRCGVKDCHGHLRYLGPLKPGGDGAARGVRQLSKYQLFVKEHYSDAYTTTGSRTGAMAWLSQKWKEEKAKSEA